MNNTIPSANARARARARQKPFVAIDGESVTENGKHIYVLMQASNGAELVERGGISTRNAFAFILRLAKETSGILVAFGLNYDVNMILRDVPPLKLVELWKTGAAIIELDSERWGARQFAIEWIPSKLFSIATENARATIYDTFGFFQQSFVNALDSWSIAAPEIIERMKAERGSFKWSNLEQMKIYNAEECRLLVELMDNVRDALRDVGLMPRSWLGAGAIASALLAKHGVDQHVADERPHVINEDVLLRSYFGGRTEIFRQGVWNEKAFAWDVNSAYPSEAIGLPTAIGKWTRSRGYRPDEPWAIWRVEWHLNDPLAPLAPFPFRDGRGIHYPLSGAGWYHAIEVAAALDVFGDQIKIKTGYVFTPATDDKPFAFLADVYDERRELKRQDHPGEKVLKLGINSVYGKLAQGTSRDGRRPRFQDYFWAGRITAGTRAKILRAAATGEHHLVAIATDGMIFAGGEPALTPHAGLGGWERTVYDDLFVAQPGVYYAHAARQRGVVKHSRGFFTREINFPKLRRAWIADGPFGEQVCDSHRFIGLGTVLMRRSFELWRTWEDSTRRLGLYSARKFYDDRDFGELNRRLLCPAEVRPGTSDPYIPKTAVIELDLTDEEWVQGNEQPMIAF